MKITLRDLLWLALLIASLTLWGIQHRRSAQQAEELKKTFFFLRDLSAGPSTAALQRRATLQRFSACTDQELDQQFAAIAAGGQWQHHANYEPYLTEMIRRKLVDQLQKHYDAMMARADSGLGFPYNLELLTALRRAQGKPDPLRIEISLADPTKVGIGMDSAAPAIQAKITNVDVGKEAVHFTRGGDYRGGRRERWRAVLTDEGGRVVRDSNFQSMIGGGISSIGPFEFGATDADGHAFDLRRYVAPTRSGKYRLQLVYHNEQDLASEPDLSGLIVTKSNPLDVIITVPARSRGMPPGVQSLLAILAAGALLAAVTLIANRKLSARDIVWSGLLIAAAIGVWQGGRYWDNKIDTLTPDAESSWSIELDEQTSQKLETE